MTGVDQTGIVHRITEVLAGDMINVASMESRVTYAAFTGTAMFSLSAELIFPDSSAGNARAGAAGRRM